MARNLYHEVSERILAELEAGAPPWCREWKARGRGNIPQNAITHRPYSGGNVILLWMSGCSQNRWMTFGQALEIGANVRKGEKSTRILYVSSYDKKKPDSDDTSKVSFLKEFCIFNIAQIENVPEKYLEARDPTPFNVDQRDEDLQDFLQCTRADIREGASEAFYSPGGDFISLPHFDDFKDSDCYAATALHELSHWSGHPSRLARDLKNRFGSQEYAAEELVAELSSAFLCGEFGINKTVRHASYIASWIKLLREDNRAFFSAAEKAQQSANYLRSLAINQLVEPEQIAAE